MLCLKQILFIFKASTICTILFISFSGSVVHSEDVTLSWNRPNDSRVMGYKIFYGSAVTDFKSVTKEIINAPDQTSLNIYDLKDGNTYGFAAKSIDGHGNESVFSEVLYYDVPETQDEKPSDDGSRTSQNKSSNGGGGCFIDFTRF